MTGSVKLKERFSRWRLNAPEGYRWTDGEVLDEKTQSFLNGVIAGVVIFGVLIVLPGARVRRD